ncbi:MAG: histidine ammonia-lyase [Bacteroidetes bacterium]|nr:histidine ammonia-lyase [Bacteroidota bacterium]
MEIHHISPKTLTIQDVETILSSKKKLALSKEAEKLIVDCRNYLDNKIATQKEPVYGVTTGFGSLCNHSISESDLGKLQENLMMSHACGIGDIVRPDIVKIMLLLKVQSLSYGKSGVQLDTVQRLIDFYNNDIIPIVYEQGSLGASGDLCPLAHLCLPLIGMGQVIYNGKTREAAEVLAELNLEAVKLASKEGLALLNGTQFMASYAVYSLIKANNIVEWADTIGALSLEAYDGRIEPFDDDVHQIRHHSGQIETAKNIRKILEGSELIKQPKKHVQDPYSFRCMPQVHGASKDAINYVIQVVTNEINAVTDNPTIFPESDKIISAGNFHGQPLALVLDFLAIALAELGNISERRIYRLIAGERGLPSFLVAHPGLNSGFMIPQYTAASIVSQNKQFCTPASVDSIESSQGQEDHVSMGANAAVKALKIAENVEKILAIELFNAGQAIEFRKPLKTSPLLESLLVKFRQYVSFVENDKLMFVEIHKSINFIVNKKPVKYV